MAHEISGEHLRRVQVEWSRYAGEAIKVDTTIAGQPIGTPILAFGSELACLRIFYRMKAGRVEYSDNLRTWFYANK